ncbi:MAG: 8-amino-7-oxononanoate synthase [Candidatus Omnitrophica bacterium]|nr:8-amino-7-oxononanoate synthase [Candidatus Omnitrophota bacterium]
MATIEEFLEERSRQGLLRTLIPLLYRNRERIILGNREYVDFSSNDYLGLAGHPRLIAESKKALDKFGTSSSASRLMSGDYQLHHLLEEKVAGFKHKEAALVFNSGYQANIGILSSLLGKRDCVFSDRMNHASIIDGILLSGARLFRYRHNDAGHLAQLLKKERGKFDKSLIITETIFSMDGDRPQLKELVYLKEKYDCWMMVDEAHATGVFGRGGSGIVEEEHLEARVDFIMGTFSKALGGFGAYLASSKKSVEYLINTCRSFIYSTALPPAIIAGNLAALDLIKDEPFRRKNLLESAEYFRENLETKGFAIKGQSQIIPLVIGDNFKALEFARKLQEKGYWVLPVRPPTVPKGQARLRFSLTYYHSKEILKNLLDDILKIKV